MVLALFDSVISSLISEHHERTAKTPHRGQELSLDQLESDSESDLAVNNSSSVGSFSSSSYLSHETFQSVLDASASRFDSAEETSFESLDEIHAPAFTFNEVQRACVLKICDILSSGDESAFLAGLSSNETFWLYLLDRLGLYGELSSETVDIESSAFFVHFRQLTWCLKGVEAETSRMLVESGVHDHKFDARFLLNLSFVAFECSATLTCQVDRSFETVCSTLLAEYVIPYLSASISAPACARLDSGRQLVESIRQALSFIESDKFLELLVTVEPSWSPTVSQTPFDIAIYVSPPGCPDERPDTCNPLTRSFACLLSNLSFLRTITHDPFSSPAVQEAFENGRVVANLQTLACLSVSYYTLGYFDIRKILFESLHQHVYDRRSVYEEFCQTFNQRTNRHGKNPQRFKRLTHSTTFDGQQAKSTKWTTTTATTTTNTTQRSIQSPSKRINVLDDILNRISTLNRCSKVRNHEVGRKSDEGSFDSARYRTVAPTKLATPIDAKGRSKRVGSSYSFSDESYKPPPASSTSCFSRSNHDCHGATGNRRHRRREDSLNCEWSGQSEASSSLSSYYYIVTQPTPVGAKLASMQTPSSPSSSSSYSSSSNHSVRYSHNRHGYRSPPIAPRPPNAYLAPTAGSRASLFYYNLQYDVQPPPRQAYRPYQPYAQTSSPGKCQSPGTAAAGYFAKHPRFSARPPQVDSAFRNQKFFR